MGNRISFHFKCANGNSAPLFSQEDGIDLVEEASAYIKWLNEEVPWSTETPLSRREKGIVMLDYLRWFYERNDIDLVEMGLALGEMTNDDHGHYEVNASDAEWNRY